MAGGTGACATQAGGLTATRSGDGWDVSGTTVPVLGAASAETYVLGAHSADGSGETLWFAVDGARPAELTVTRLNSVDLTRDIGRVTLSGLHVPADQLLAVDSARLRSTAAALFSAESAGVARWCQAERARLHEGARAVRAAYRRPSRRSSTSAPGCSSAAS